MLGTSGTEGGSVALLSAASTAALAPADSVASLTESTASTGISVASSIDGKFIQGNNAHGMQPKTLGMASGRVDTADSNPSFGTCSTLKEGNVNQWGELNDLLA